MVEHIDAYDAETGRLVKRVRPHEIARAATNELPHNNGHIYYTAVHEDGECAEHEFTHR